MEQILAITSLLVLVLYNTYMVYLNGWKTPESISETSYISNKRFNTTLPFSMMCLLCAVGIFPLWTSVSLEMWQFLVFLSCSGIIFAGCTPFFKEEFESTIHYTSGIIAFLSGIIWLCVTHNWLPIILIGLIGGLLTLFQKTKFVFIFETIGYITISLCLHFQ